MMVPTFGERVISPASRETIGSNHIQSRYLAEVHQSEIATLRFEASAALHAEPDARCDRARGGA